jgi:DNA polymerase delta subunit 2
VNLFLYHSEEEDEKDVIGEVELMIASRAQQGQGFGRASLVAFFEYLSRHEEEIVGTFVGQTERHPAPRIFKHLRVKVNETNERSINLFSSVGFEKVSHVANYFGELELRMQHDLQAFSRHVATDQLEEYREVEYLESM